MLHFGPLDIRTDIFVLFLSVLTGSLQIILCFKVKKKGICLLPVYLLSVMSIVPAGLGILFDGWDRVGFFFLAACCAIQLLCCGIGWGVWAIVRQIKTR